MNASRPALQHPDVASWLAHHGRPLAGPLLQGEDLFLVGHGSDGPLPVRLGPEDVGAGGHHWCSARDAADRWIGLAEPGEVRLIDQDTGQQRSLAAPDDGEPVHELALLDDAAGAVIARSDGVWLLAPDAPPRRLGPPGPARQLLLTGDAVAVSGGTGPLWFPLDGGAPRGDRSGVHQVVRWTDGTPALLRDDGLHTTQGLQAHEGATAAVLGPGGLVLAGGGRLRGPGLALDWPAPVVRLCEHGPLLGVIGPGYAAVLEDGHPLRAWSWTTAQPTPERWPPA